MPQVQPPVITKKGAFRSLNLTAATVVATGKRQVCKVSVIVAGSTAGGVHDIAATGSVATANQLAVIPTTVGVYDIDMPTLTGITIAPGTGQTIVVSYI